MARPPASAFAVAAWVVLWPPVKAPGLAGVALLLRRPVFFLGWQTCLVLHKLSYMKQKPNQWKGSPHT